MEKEIRSLPGLKERDLAPCSACGKRHEAPVFYRVTVEQYGMVLAAVQRQIGLGMMMGGNAAIASALGPDEDMAKQISKSTVTLCLDCAMSLPVLVSVDQST